MTKYLWLLALTLIFSACTDKDDPEPEAKFRLAGYNISTIRTADGSVTFQYSIRLTYNPDGTLKYYTIDTLGEKEDSLFITRYSMQYQNSKLSKVMYHATNHRETLKNVITRDGSGRITQIKDYFPGYSGENGYSGTRTITYNAEGKVSKIEERRADNEQEDITFTWTGDNITKRTIENPRLLTRHTVIQYSGLPEIQYAALGKDFVLAVNIEDYLGLSLHQPLKQVNTTETIGTSRQFTQVYTANAAGLTTQKMSSWEAGISDYHSETEYLYEKY